MENRVGATDQSLHKQLLRIGYKIPLVLLWLVGTDYQNHPTDQGTGIVFEYIMAQSQFQGSFYPRGGTSQEVRCDA